MSKKHGLNVLKKEDSAQAWSFSTSPFFTELEDFKTIFELKSISQASVALSKDQGNLSKSVKRLEGKVNAKLFVRFKGGVEPTLKGSELYASITQMNTIWGLMKSGATETEIPSSIRIAVHRSIATAYLGKVIERICNLAPHIYPEVIFCNSVEATKKVQSREVDLGIVANPIRSEDLIIKPLAKEKILLCASDKNSQARFLLKNSSMLHVQQLIKKLKSEKVIDIDDYDVAASICKTSSDFSCVIPSSVCERYGLYSLSELKSKIDIKLITYPGNYLAGKMKDLIV